jgi:glutamate--cysteine ligase
MIVSDPSHLTRERLLDFFLQSAKPKERWLVGMELEKMGRTIVGGRPIPFDGDGPTVLKVLEFIQERRGGEPICEGAHLIGIEGSWGTITLEPGGQVEWSSRPRTTLSALREELDAHNEVLREAGEALGVNWLDVAVDPVHSIPEMPWMPKARYSIMAPYLGQRGRLAHRMMTQSASIQVAFDYSDPEDWRRKFKAASLLTPMAVALFANSSHIDGADSGYRSYRQVIWRETDPDRCGLPRSVFEPGFGLESWLDYALRVPTMFRHRARGLVPTGGVPFGDLLELSGCDALKREDWETHLSTIFTEVRSYGYIEVRSADLQPDHSAIAVPIFWTGLLYDSEALSRSLELGACLDDYATWLDALESAARSGLQGEAAGRQLSEMAREALKLSRAALLGGAPCAGDGLAEARSLDELAERLGLGSLD